MKSRALRYALATLCVGVLGAAAYVTWVEESEGRAAATAARQFDDRSRSTARALLDIKSAQPGYVAAGQGDEFWTTKVDRSLDLSREGLAALRSLAGTPSAQTEIESAIAALEDFEQMDRRAREYARSGQRLLASDLVYSDGIEKMEVAISAVERARTSELDASDSVEQRHRLKKWLASGGAAAMSLLALFLLVRLPDEPGAPVVDATQPEPAADYPIGRSAPSATGTDLSPAPITPTTDQVEPGPSSAESVDIASVAALCSELARIVDTRSLPAALERAAKLLQASGIIVWIADPDGRELVPVVSHGYPPHFLTRLGNIERDAENVTAAAFRTGVIQTVKADSEFPGAIAAPLPTPAGPVGVMAAEVLNAREQQDQTLSIAAIVAAQLAALLAPPVRATGNAEAAG